MIERAIAEAVLRDVIAACDPAARVRDAFHEPEVKARLTGRGRYAIAIGKAALAMARGAGEVVAGLAVVPRGGGGELPGGWRLIEGSHPVPDEHSVAAGHELQAFVASVPAAGVIIALLSGGASALAELPLVPLDELVATVRGVMAAGAAIDEINTVRGALSAIKAGRLVQAAAAPVITLAVSDVIGDPLAVIGSGPTVGPWLASPGVAVGDDAAVRRQRARAVLERHGVAVPPMLAADADSADDAHAPTVIRTDYADVIAAMSSAAYFAVRYLALRVTEATLSVAPVEGDVAAVARLLVDRQAGASTAIVAWGEPTLRVPAGHGVGGRAQQLALTLAQHLRGGDLSALVVGTDGIDGPPPPDRPAPAGAWIDGTTWDAIIAAGHDPAAALTGCDAGTVLHAVGALVVTGATGINHADLVIIG